MCTSLGRLGLLLSKIVIVVKRVSHDFAYYSKIIRQCFGKKKKKNEDYIFMSRDGERLFDTYILYSMNRKGMDIYIFKKKKKLYP
jgi:hypothetical protein